MADYSRLRTRYAKLIAGEGNGKYVERNDRITKAHIENINIMIKEAHIKKVPSVTEAIEGMSYSTSINSVFKAIYDMSVSFSESGSIYYNSHSLLSLITGSLEKMRDIYNDTTEPYGNWWHWEIGCPLSINNTFALIYDHADKELLNSYMNAEMHFNNEIKLTGANRVWESVIFAVRGILLENSECIRAAVSGISDVMVMTNSGDGFYSDGSFVQHGKFPYNGGYGRSLLQELAPILYLLSGTEFEPKDIGVIYKWVENSYFPFLENGRMMDMVRGREVSREYSKCDAAGASMLGAMLIISDLPGRENRELKARIKGQLSDGFFEFALPFAADIAAAVIDDTTIIPYEEKPYFKAFNSMDRAVKHGRDYAVGLAMHSERIANYESINDENGRAYHSADGMLYTYKKSEPWADFFWQTIDVQRLPGTTVLNGTEVEPNKTSACDFVGGCGIDEFGVCAMELTPVGYSLHANKAWFFFDDEIVCMGSGIVSSTSENVETIIENRLVTDDSRFTISGVKINEGYDIKDAYLDGMHDTGYYFPKKQHVRIIREVRKGGSGNINIGKPMDECESMYVTMWIDHGRKPMNASYEYIVIPKCGEEQLKEYGQNSGVKIVENSEWIQCVKKENVTGIIFLKDGTWSVEGIASDKRCIAMIKQNGNNLDFVVVDPTQKQKSIDFVFEYSAKSVAKCDDRIKVEQLSPFVLLRVDTNGADGRELRIRLEGIEHV